MDREDIHRFIRENTPLVICFCVPLVILFIVLTFQAAQRAAIKDPQFGAVFVTNYDGFSRHRPYDVLVEHGKLVVEKMPADPRPEIPPPDYSVKPLIFFFDNRTQNVTLLNIDFNKVAPNDRIVSPDITAINNKPLVTSRLSPDGYMFSYRVGRAEKLVAGLFKSSVSHQGYAVYKNSKIIPLVYGGKRVINPQFLAWVDTSP